MPTNYAVGNDLWKDFHEFTQQLQGIATNLQALTSYVETVELHAVEKVDSNITDLHKYQMGKLDFAIYGFCGLLPKLERLLLLIYNKLEPGGGIDWNGKYFSYEKEAAQWFQDHKATICIFVDDISLLHAIGATFVYTFEATCTREVFKKSYFDYDLEASIYSYFITTLPSILVSNMEDSMGVEFEILMGYLKDYTVWHPCGTKL